MTLVSKPRVVVALISLLLAITAIMPMSNANAMAAIGAGAACKPGDATKCVLGEGGAVSAGTSLTGAEGVVACAAETTGADLTSIDCWSKWTGTFTSSSGQAAHAAARFPSPDDIDPFEVCWVAKGIFSNLNGAPDTVTHTGCAIVEL
jgi:hypothetical protein